MPSLRSLANIFLGVLLLAVPARATWSILIIDTATGEVALGIATCLTGFDLRPSTVVVVPGVGVAAAQSFVGPLSLRQLIRAELIAGTTPQQILALLQAADPGHQSRQYGIAAVSGGTVAFTGSGAGAYAGDLTGQVGTLVYTVQGNVLTGQPVLTAAEQAILTTPGDVAEKLMAAMQAARSMGGDGRCSCAGASPTSCGSPPANFTKSAHIGLMIVSRPGDLDAPCGGGLGCGAGTYWMDLNIAGQSAGAPDPVVQLQNRFNLWRAAEAGRPDHFQSTATVDTSSIRANGYDTATTTVVLRNAQGTPLGNSVPLTVALNPASTTSAVQFGPVVAQPNGSYTFTVAGDLAAGEAILDVVADDGIGTPVRISPAPQVTITDPYGSCGVGAISNGAGGTIDALRIGGSGGQDRVVRMGFGQPFVLTVDPPVGSTPGGALGAFALWAHLGIPDPAFEWPISSAGGSLCFLPAPFNPTAPTLLVADSFGLGGAFLTNPAPWTLGFPGLFAQLDVTLQAVMITDLQGSLAATNALALRIDPLPPLTISQVTPPSAAAGTSVTITGTEFYTGLQLEVGNIPTPVTQQTSTQVDFIVPPGVSCDSQVSLTNPGGSPVTASFNATPIIQAQPFTSGSAAGGAFYLIGGQNLQNCTVTFNGAPMNITASTFASIVGTTPPGNVGPATVVVSNAAGCQATTTYTYQ